MNPKESIQIVSDTVKTVKTDSLAMIDSIKTHDSLLNDTINRIISIPRGYLGKSIPSHPQSEHWVFGTLIVLFILLVLSSTRSTGFFSDTLKTYFQVKDRSSIFSKTTISDFRYRFFIILFSIGVIGLYAYLLLYIPNTDFTLLKYTYFLGITAAYFILKIGLLNLVGYVFTDTRNQKLVKDAYFDVILLLGVTLFPLLIINIYSDATLSNVTQFISLIVCTLALVLIIIKLMQIFLHKAVAIFYILLYLCTLEILPLIALCWVYTLIV